MRAALSAPACLPPKQLLARKPHEHEFRAEEVPPGPRPDLREAATRADGGCGEGLGWRLNQARVTMTRAGDEVITEPS